MFDSRCANVHVDDTNDVAYTPFPLKLLGALAQLTAHLAGDLARAARQLAVTKAKVDGHIARLDRL